MNANPPEGIETINAEGADIAAAVGTAASELGVSKNGVQWSLDKSWFKDENGRVVPRDTVRIFAWARNPEEMEAANDAQNWLEGLLNRMDFEKSSVEGDVGANNTVILKVTVDAPSRLVGRRGKTLKAIRHLLMQSVGADYPNREFRLEVPDNRDDRDDRGGRDRDDRGRDRDDRGRGRDRDDRGRGRDRDDRGRGRDRDDRGRGRDRDDRGRGRDRDDRGGRDRDRDARDTKRLERMAQKIADRVRETGEAEVIRKELNGFDRRIVHITVAEIDGVNTRSIGDGNLKQIEIYAEAGGSNEE